MLSSSFRAMGTVVEVRAPVEPGLLATRELFEEIEQGCSRFRPDSDLSELNRSALPRVALSPVMQAVMGKAAIARTRTEGLVNVGVGNAVIEWGYGTDFRSVEDQPEAPVISLEWDWELDGDDLLRAPGVKIDLGGVAKGWACDLAVEAGHAAVVSAGGDLRSNAEDTTVEILDPWNEPVCIVPLGIGALATSSVTRRRWRAGSADAHHIIDPRTGRPSHSPVLSATAVTSTAVEAEAAAKAILMLGTEGLAWAEQQSWIEGAVVVWHDASVYATPGLVP